MILLFYTTRYTIKILAAWNFFMRKKYPFYCDSLRGERSYTVTAYTKSTTVEKIQSKTIGFIEEFYCPGFFFFSHIDSDKIFVNFT